MIESNLDQIAEVVAGRVIGDGTCRFRGVGTDTRSELEGRLFIAIPGENHDGHDHLAAARAAGASAALIESGFVDRGGVLPEGFDVVMVPSVRPALAAMASAHRDTLERRGDRYHRVIGEDHGSSDGRTGVGAHGSRNGEHSKFQQRPWGAAHDPGGIEG